MNKAIEDIGLAGASIDLKDLPSLSLDQRGELPETPGVYLAIDGEGNVQYIGQAENLRTRWAYHHRRIELEVNSSDVRIAWVSVDKPFLKHIEQALIAYFKPCLNNLRNPVERKKIIAEYEVKHPPLSCNKKYSEVRDREYLLESEVKAMMVAAKSVGRSLKTRHRDSILILVAYRHGLRISELVNLRWQQVDLKTAHLHVRRLKDSRPSVHPIAGDELRSLRQLLRDNSESPYVFCSSNGSSLTPDAARKVIRRAGELAGLQFPVHPHMLRHGTGYYLAAKGTDTRTIQDYLGHKNIHHTVRYTALSPQRFDGLWED